MKRRDVLIRKYLKYIFFYLFRRTNQDSNISVCKFYDYSPYVFYEIRRIYGIRNEEYLRSIGPETMISNLIKGNLNTLQELVSTGKSGSFFYYTADGIFKIKKIFLLSKKNIQKFFYKIIFISRPIHFENDSLRGI
jgi:1-phosphatidylinositol-4-phosphate 5-kinase